MYVYRAAPYRYRAALYRFAVRPYRSIEARDGCSVPWDRGAEARDRSRIALNRYRGQRDGGAEAMDRSRETLNRGAMARFPYIEVLNRFLVALDGGGGAPYRSVGSLYRFIESPYWFIRTRDRGWRAPDRYGETLSPSLKLAPRVLTGLPQQILDSDPGCPFLEIAEVKVRS
jgi:hypothetical protein